MSVQATQENLPERVGRYDVLFRLETGVDASILVARAAEPGASPVTIKRIAPAVTQGKDIGAFLARARAAAALSHPNVVTIRDVIEDAEALSVVTEYLDGENVATLGRRLVVENKSLGFGLAAYVVAEAAAGVAAGHAANLLHQYLTPDDILVGYDGTVKVLDIGIASAVAALARTQTISEHELPYASPERCKGEPIDKRSDVYSLGTVLWELMTGVSPFERDAEAATLRAIMSEDPRLPPMNVLRSLPSELSEIAICAIHRDPGSRFPSAGALHEALTTFIGSVPMGGGPPSASLAILMQNVFAKRIRNNARLLRRADSTRNSGAAIAAPVEAPPAVEVTDLQRPTVDAFLPATLPTPPGAFEVLAPPPPPPPPPLADPPATSSFADEPVEAPVVLPGVSTGRWLVPAIGGLAVLVLVLGWFVLSGGSRRAPAATVTSSEPPRDVSAPASASARAVPPPALATSVGETTLRIDSVPPKATILLDGASVGVSPMDLKVRRSDKPIVVELRHPGYETWRESVVPDVDQKLRLSLEPARGATPPPTAAPRPKPAVSASATPYRRFD